MSHLSKLRRAVHYETNIPRCGSCQHYRPPQTYLRDSLPRVSDPLCQRHSFTVRPNAICDRWASAAGESLLPLRDQER